MSKRIHRRNFLKTGALALGLPTIVPSSVLGQGGQIQPSGRVNVGLIGCGGIVGKAQNRFFTNPKSQLMAVCDPIRERRLLKKKQVDAGYAKLKGAGRYDGCVAYNDFRDLLANKDVDAVQISTGDYWHVPISIMAARAGKDLHTEKPLGLCINECLQMEKAVDKYDRVFQYGTEGRSMTGTRVGIELVLNGHIGDVQRIYVWAPPGSSGGDFTPAPIPDGIDYDLWLGPAPEAPYSPGRCPGHGKKAIFHYYDYCIGYIAAWGAHPLNLYQWWADHAGLTIPNTIEGTGIIPAEGVYNTITNWNVRYQYDNGPEFRFYDHPTAKEEIPKVDEIKGFDPRWIYGVIFVGTKGQLHVKHGMFKTDPVEIGSLGENPGPIRLRQSEVHETDWVDAILAREDPVSDIRSAVRSDIISHLGDIAIRTGRKIKWDDTTKTIIDDEAARAMMYRQYRKPWSIDV